MRLQPKRLAGLYFELSKLVEAGASLSGIDHATIVRHSCILLNACEFEAAAHSLRCAEVVMGSATRTSANIHQLAQKYLSIALGLTREHI